MKGGVQRFSTLFDYILRGTAMRVLYLTAINLLLASVLLGYTTAVKAQNRSSISELTVNRTFTIDGYVALPDGSPARRILVKISNRGGMTREMMTNDQGRFDFKEMPAGSYRLAAHSATDLSLNSDIVETDTTRTATDTLNVNLFLRRLDSGGETKKASAVSVAEATQKIPKEAQKAFNQGLKFKDERKFEEALANFNRAVNLFPEYFQALAERGDLYVSHHQLAEAAADFQSALKINAQYGHALRGGGYCKLEKKDFAGAAHDFEQAITAEPDNFNAYLLLGIANLELDRREAARKALEQALKINPNGAVRAHIYLANLHARQGAYKEAADELHTYLDQNPADPEAEKLKGVEAKWRARQPQP
jgi:tetratricopeptide (TPR) repeat protein